MTVLTQTKKVTVNGNGASTVFSFSPLVIYDADDLYVVHVDSAGTETALSRGTGASAYSVSVSTYPGTGSITYPQDAVTPLPSGQSLVIKRLLTLEQNVNLENQGGYNPDTIEQFALDKLAIFDLQQQEEIERSLRLPISSSASTTLPTAVADTVLGWNSGGTALENKTSTGTIGLPINVDNLDVAADIKTALNTANFPALRTAIGLAIGSDVQAYDADTLKADVADTLSVQMAQTLQTDTSSSGAVTFDFAGGACFLDLTENLTDINFTNMRANAWHFLLIQQGSGGHTGTGYDTNVKHPGDTEPTFSTTNNAWDLFGIYYDGTNALMVTIAQDLR